MQESKTKGKILYDKHAPGERVLSMLATINYLVALLALVLALSSYLLLKRYGVPDKICVGAAFLAIVVVAIFWTAVRLGADDDEAD